MRIWFYTCTFVRQSLVHTTLLEFHSSMVAFIDTIGYSTLSQFTANIFLKISMLYQVLGSDTEDGVWSFALCSEDIDEYMAFTEAQMQLTKIPTITVIINIILSNLSFNEEDDDFLALSLSTSISLLKMSSSGFLKHNASMFVLIFLQSKSSVPSQ